MLPAPSVSGGTAQVHEPTKALAPKGIPATSVEAALKVMHSDRLHRFGGTEGMPSEVSQRGQV